MSVYDSGHVQPNAILAVLRHLNLEVPDKRKLVISLTLYKKEKYGKCCINMTEVEDWCKIHKTIPTNIDQVFVLDHEISADKDDKLETLRVFFTTLRLIGLAKLNAKYICAIH